MARNTKREYIKKLLAVNTKNGYKIDIGNYLYNPAFDNEYPALRKKVEETPEKITYSTVYYMRYYDGTAEYKLKEYTAPNTKDTWNIVTVTTEKVLETAKRFSLNRLIELCESI